MPAIEVENVPVEKASCGGYTILKTLGRGGNAVVKLVEKDDEVDGQCYAMKIFKTERMGNAAETIQHLQKEMEIVHSLNLESVPRYYEFKEDYLIKKTGSTEKREKVFFLVMDYIEGCTLFEFFIKVGR